MKAAGWTLQGMSMFIVGIGVYLAPMLAFALAIINGATMGARLLVSTVTQLIVLNCPLEYQLSVKLFFDRIGGVLFGAVCVAGAASQFKKVRQRMRRGMTTEGGEW